LYSVQSGSKYYVSASIFSVSFYVSYIELSQSQHQYQAYKYAYVSLVY